MTNKNAKNLNGIFALAGLVALTSVPLDNVFGDTSIEQFTSIAESAVCATVSDPYDTNAPWVLPEGYTQTVIANEFEAGVNDLLDMNQQNQKNIDYPTVLSSDDKKASKGQLLYTATEVGINGQVTVTDLETGEVAILAQESYWNRLDGVKWTPWNTVLVGEEVSNDPGKDPDVASANIHGLVYELDPVTGEHQARPAIGSLAHEGIGIDKRGEVYVIDETTPGGIFRFIPDTYGDLSSGQLYAIKITENDGDNTGKAEWIALDRDAVKVNARQAAIDAGVTGWERPEDIDIMKETLYAAITGTDRVLAIELNKDVTKEFMVTNYVKAGENVPVEIDNVGDETDEITGFNSPDNLAITPSGDLVIVEDNTPSDIWFASPDRNNDGQADEVVLFASLRDCRAEGTGILMGVGLYSNTLFVNQQHAGSPDGTSGTAPDQIIAITRN
ncbi:MAG: DUF839 domain-containing protein [Nitrosarchaeum sp.]|nr:DUF839 domain-containing protein [Nitrosarchaeum sp.]